MIQVKKCTTNDLSIEDETYLCLLCLRDSTARIVVLYANYIKLRQGVSGKTPLLLIGMLMTLQKKWSQLQNRLQSRYPQKMATGKWHEQQEQIEILSHLTEDSRNSLQQICQTEMKVMTLVSEMIKQ